MKGEINFSKLDGLVPCIVQDAETNVVLMLGFMNEEAYKKTIQEKKVTFYSRTKKRLWTKGETSGNYLELVDIQLDCDADTLLLKAKPTGPVCHTGSDTCFGEKNNSWSLKTLQDIIINRKQHPAIGSYTSGLFERGINAIAQKVGEEAVELILESKDENNERFLNEAADLLFHYLVLLQAKNCSLEDVLRTLKERH